ncbi:crotonobetainyl-CoA:carnitine CoA-transferase CaiB-like acyl-CoA transferase [Antricoccus suffuscus]|uniref:Crotonobetainyl-CoA:carnitine CoA-transferase CaiB-like acyl-CoA transferase n=1 Tax=Antricoccus suffuscus TaxID=1629062 RepID=A0A2T1A413_9ACTN|nr:CoA transferase [Antricoccus suffuscus]PRZ43326.1 crotonobetainyl-CoA:carnitine CoA-transferase CaiB-like acyl-CoA transferase [Antricoccus suffuscus]
MKKIFEGLKVIDCASFIAAPAAAAVLSDFGADVIKIEPPGAGDPGRQLYTFPGMPKSELNYSWMMDNRSKRGLALDLTKPAGQAVIHKLVGDADVFLTNYPLPVRDKLAIDYDTLALLNDRLVYASFTGFGETGAEATKPGFDMTGWWARSGLMDAVREHHDAEPVRSLPGMGDHPSAMSFFSAIMMGLYERTVTGKGSLVRSSLVSSGVWANGFNAQAALVGAQFEPRPPRAQGGRPLSCYYRCRDDKWIVLTILNETKQWPILVDCIARPELAEDPRFVTQKDRFGHGPELIGILDEVFATKDRSEWQRILLDAGLVFEVVASAEDIPNDQQLIDNGYLVPIVDSEYMTVDSPLTVAGTEKARPTMAPTLGQHSDDVLREAGYDDDAIKDLRAAGVVA